MAGSAPTSTDRSKGEMPHTGGSKSNNATATKGNKGNGGQKLQQKK
ncbi:MAG TPA: hypothetical protein VGU19_05465 [Microvirga sp.]|jgi:hypothetical protein|nr:hypothetical protein [Microvirga sp.]